MYTGPGLYLEQESPVVTFTLLPLPRTQQNTRVEIMVEAEEVVQDGLEHIRSKYHVPCYKGSIIQFRQSDSVTRMGVVLGPFKKDRILIQLEGDTMPSPFHPKACISYQATNIFH